MSRSYQDYVIRDGRLVGDFEGLYQEFEDPWHQSRADHLSDSRRVLAVDHCVRLRSQFGMESVSRVVEVGCGFGYMTEALRQRGFSAIGVDTSAGAVQRAREKNPGSVFLQRTIESPDLLNELDPDIVIMAEVTWYVLEHLESFLGRLRDFAARRDRPTFLIHLLSTYAPGVQVYGREFFTDLDGILEYFDMDLIESGVIKVPRIDDPDSQGTYFVARVPSLEITEPDEGRVAT